MGHYKGYCDRTYFRLTGEESSEIERHLPQFFFYRKSSGHEYDVYCTSCKDRWAEDGRRKRITFKHKYNDVCPCCGEHVQVRQMDRGRTSYYCWSNFAIIRTLGYNKVRLYAVGVIQTFDEDILQPEFDAYLREEIELSPGEAHRYKEKWVPIGGWDWVELKTIREPAFYNSAFGYADNSYHIIGEDELNQSFLKYGTSGIPAQPGLYVTYLCRLAQHPNIEYLVKGGFYSIAEAYLIGNRLNTRINWKSNDLKKMLHINRTELARLKDHGAETYCMYISFRRNLPGVDTVKCIDYFDEFFNCDYYLDTISQNYGVTWKETMDYLRKQKQPQTSSRLAVQSYKDYLDECKKLKYDLTRQNVLKPRDLWSAHERTAKILSVVTAEEKSKRLAEKLRKSDKERKGFEYVDRLRGLVIVLPKSINDIIAEGRMQNHCVAGYADRHAEGKLHILFLRRITEPKKPYYTMEVSVAGKIMQCRGYANNVEYNGGRPKPQEIKDFEEEYQEYLNGLFAERRAKKQKVRKSA